MQAGVDHVLDVLPAGDACGDFLLGAGQKFGGYHHILPFSEVPQGAAQILFAGAALVAHGGIKEVDAQLQPFFDDCTGMRFIDRPAMLAVSRFSASHTTHTNTGYTQIGVPQFRILHKLTFPKNRMGPAAFLPCRDSRRRRHSRGPTV